jgi:hypothetical protein
VYHGIRLLVALISATKDNLAADRCRRDSCLVQRTVYPLIMMCPSRSTGLANRSKVCVTRGGTDSGVRRHVLMVRTEIESENKIFASKMDQISG